MELENEINYEQVVSRKNGILAFVMKVMVAVILMIVIGAVIIFSTQERGVPLRFIGGYSAMTALTGSMYPELPVGTMILIGPVAEREIEVGSVITFVRNDRRVISHRVVGIEQDYMHGRPGFRTQGDAVATADPEIVRAENVLGRVIWSNNFFGNIVTTVQRNPFVVLGGTGVVVVGAVVLVIKKQSSE